MNGKVTTPSAAGMTTTAGLGGREIIAAVAISTVTNDFNQMAQTGVDFPLAETTKAAA